MDEPLHLALYRGTEAILTLDAATLTATAAAMVLPEDVRVAIELTPRQHGREYQVKVGDEAFAPTHSGRRSVEWEDKALFFDSARGPTRLVLEDRVADSGERWREIMDVELLITPTKINATAFDCMVDDLAQLASGLLFDLLAKSSLRIQAVDAQRPVGIFARSPQAELRLLGSICQRMSKPLDLLLQQPETVLTRRQRLQACYGHEAFSPTQLSRLAGRGLDLRRADFVRPFSADVDIIHRSADILENRIILAFLHLLANRAKACRERAREQMSQMDDRVRHWLAAGAQRDVFDHERPHREKLVAACDEADFILRQLGTAIVGLGILTPYSFDRGVPDTPLFRNVAQYHHLWRVMRQYLSDTVISLEIGAQERLKQTWRMYEQWVFLQLAEAVRNWGLSCTNSGDFLAALSRRRFTIDLQRDSYLVFTNNVDTKVVITYEPTIFRKDIADKAGARVFSGMASDLPLSPDVLIEILRLTPSGSYEVVSAAVVDAKYSRTPEVYVERCLKYQKIRHTGTNRPIVKQVWIAAPVSEGIYPEDSAVIWTDEGPLIEKDEFIAGHFGMTPGREADEANDEGSVNAGARRFVHGLFTHLGVNPSSRSMERSSQARSIRS